MKKSNAYSTKSDVEVIKIYKNNSHWRTKQEIEAHLYQKYSPLCKKYSYKYRYLSTMEDNMQDCYLQMVQALDFIDVNKITDAEKYSFGITFGGYLSSHFISQLKQKKDDTIEYDSQQEQNFAKVMATSKSPEEQVIFNIFKKEFENTLPEKEKILFQMLTDGMQKKVIAKELGEKHTANLTFWVNKIQKKYIAYTQLIGYELTV